MNVLYNDMSSLFEEIKEYYNESDDKKPETASYIFQEFFSVVWDATGFMPLENVVSLYLSVMFSTAKCALNAGTEILRKRKIQIDTVMELYQLAHGGDYATLNERLSNTISETSDGASFLDSNKSNFAHLVDFIQKYCIDEENTCFWNMFGVSGEFLQELLGLNSSYEEENYNYMNNFKQMLKFVQEEREVIYSENYDAFVELASMLGQKLGSGGTSILNSGYSSDECAEEANRAQSDPLIVDMDNDGFEMTDTENDAYFDLNCDGFAEKVA